jgi:long-chain fatty acid transport protein
MKTLVTLAALIAVTLAAVAAARAGGYAVPEQVVTAGGTAGAATARADDAGAAWYNPAALADGGGWRVGAGLILAVTSLHAEGEGWRSTTEAGPTPVPQLHASVAAADLVLGVAVGVPYGGNVAWPADWAGRSEIIATRLAVVRVAPFAGWRFGRLRIAGGVHVDLAQLRLQRSLDFVDTEGDVEILMTGAAVGADLSAFVRISDEVDVGASYRSRSRIDLSGDADFTAPDAFSAKVADQAASTEVAIPDRIAIGGAWHRGRLAVVGDLEVTTWSGNRQQVIDFAREQTPDVVQVNQWSSTVAVRAGAEWRAGRWTARGGVAYDPSPASADRLTPVSPDADRVQASAGGSWQLSPALAVDGFYAWLHLLGRQSANPDSMMARYGGDAHLLGVAVRWSR